MKNQGIAVLLLLVAIFMISKNSEGIPLCEIGFKGCCPGYVWNETISNCSECMDGFIGENCSYSCPYPSYGKKCLKICTCSNESCDPISGCIEEQVTTMVGNPVSENRIEKSNFAFYIVIIMFSFAIILNNVVWYFRNQIRTLLLKVRGPKNESIYESTQIEDAVDSSPMYDQIKRRTTFQGMANVSIIYEEKQRTYSFQLLEKTINEKKVDGRLFPIMTNQTPVNDDAVIEYEEPVISSHQTELC